MSNIRYGVIGLGFFGEIHAQVIADSPGVDLVAVCTRRDVKRRAVKRKLGVPKDYRDYQDLLADPEIDAVSIVTHVDDHLTPTLAALKAGKHVLLEKPMARTVAECDRIAKAAAKAKGIFMVGHICRFNPRYAIARQRVAAGEIGKVVSMYARRNIPAARSKSVLHQIGPILGDGIHDTDLMLWIAGEPIETAQALTYSVRGLPNPDIGWTMYRFASGAIGVCENVWFLPDSTPIRIHEQLEVIGTEGAIYIHGADMNVAIHGRKESDYPDTIYWPEIHGQVTGALREEIAYFVKCAAVGETPSVVTPQAARDAVAATVAAEQSARSGKVVKVPGEKKPKKKSAKR